MLRRVLILGGDGFCGWPMALRLSALGCHVTIVDNFSRRRIAQDMGAPSLTPICALADRVRVWNALQHRDIDIAEMDLATDFDALCDLLRAVSPNAIIHFAAQRSAPYSMLSPQNGRYTIGNNVRITHNILTAMVATQSLSHLVHLGSIGVYGYASAGLQLPEGYLKIQELGQDGRGAEREILYPGTPDSLYHLTKSLDQQLFAFFARRYGLPITDLHQGIVWGTQTKETQLAPALVNRFDHDDIYGTVVNRFLLQAATGEALTVYGSGAQKRAYIHICDVMRCILTALDQPPQRGDRVRIINQVAETKTVGELAQQIASLTNTRILQVKNPRVEPEDDDFDVEQTQVQGMDFTPRTFNTGLAAECRSVCDLVAQHASTRVS